MQRHQRLRASGPVQAIHVLRNHAVDYPGALKFHQRKVRAVGLGLVHHPPTHKTPSPVAVRGRGIIAEFLIGHRAMPRQRPAWATVVGDARIGGHASSRQHSSGTKVHLLNDALQRLLRWRRHSGVADHARNRAQCGAVSEFYGCIMEVHES